MQSGCGGSQPSAPPHAHFAARLVDPVTRFWVGNHRTQRPDCCSVTAVAGKSALHFLIHERAEFAFRFIPRNATLFKTDLNGKEQWRRNSEGLVALGISQSGELIGFNERIMPRVIRPPYTREPPRIIREGQERIGSGVGIYAVSLQTRHALVGGPDVADAFAVVGESPVACATDGNLCGLGINMEVPTGLQNLTALSNDRVVGVRNARTIVLIDPATGEHETVEAPLPVYSIAAVPDGGFNAALATEGGETGIVRFDGHGRETARARLKVRGTGVPSQIVAAAGRVYVLAGDIGNVLVFSLK